MNPYSPGGITDMMSRSLAGEMSAHLGQPVVVINRDGAAGAIGTGVVAAARPDGYQLLFVPALVITVLPAMRPDLAYGFDAFDPVCQTFENVMALAVRPDSAFRSIAEVVGFAKANPGRLSYGHQGIGSIPHLATSELVLATGVEIAHIPYRGDAAVLTDLAKGDIDLGAVVMGSLVGREFRILGVFAEDRHPRFPEVPTMREQGFAVQQSSFGGLLAPKGTPAAILQQLEQACAQAAASESYRTVAARANQPTVYYRDRAEFARRLEDDRRRKSEIIKTLKITE
jgi:tripartite-type tricarboxylate transporter receptor subunit TctC